jgi:hypothetical protein
VPDRGSTDHRKVGCFHGHHRTSGNWPFNCNQETDFTPIYRTGFDAALAHPPFFPTKVKQAVERKAFMQSARGRIVGIAGPRLHNSVVRLAQKAMRLLSSYCDSLSPCARLFLLLGLHLPFLLTPSPQYALILAGGDCP